MATQTVEGSYYEEDVIVTNESSTRQRKEVTQLWKKIWAARIPNKVQMLAWRISHDFLPVMTNLFRRKVSTQLLCPLYGMSKETALHALRYYMKASDVWRMTQLQDQWKSEEH